MIYFGVNEGDVANLRLDIPHVRTYCVRIPRGSCALRPDHWRYGLHLPEGKARLVWFLLFPFLVFTLNFGPFTLGFFLLP